MSRLIRLKYKRRSQSKTDYKKRLALLSTNLPRIIIRTSNKGILVQLAEYHEDGDKILLTSSSKDLKNYKWSSRRNLPSAYLTGLLFGSKIKAKIKKAILDLGPFSSIKGSIKYAVLKGIVDAGVDVPHQDDVLPTDDRIQGKHIADYAKTTKDKFSLYSKEGINVEDLPKLFEETKNKIMKEGRNVSKEEKTVRK